MGGHGPCRIQEKYELSLQKSVHKGKFASSVRSSLSP